MIAYPGGPNPQAPGLDTFQSLTETTSHELAEAVTDPYVNAQGNPSGWDDYSFTPGDAGEGEIADIADGLGAPPAYLTDNGMTYAVSELWSNQAGAAVAPGTSTTATPPTTTPTTTPSPTMTSTLTVTGDDVTAQAGQLFQVTVATVSNPGDAGPLVARIDWGDGSWPSLVRLQGPDAQGNFTVAGWHDYHGAGSYTINVTVLDLRSGAEGSATATADVSAANSVSVTGQRIEATAGQSFTGTVARVSDPNASASNLTATIDWGDGSAANPDVTAGTVTTDGNGHLIVQGTHTYAKVGNYPVTVTVTDGTTGAQGKALSVADVDPAPSLPVAGVNVAAAPGQSFTDVIGVVEAHGASASDLSVTVNWGDGTTDSTGGGNSNVQVVPFGMGGRFVIVGTHTYASAGQDTISFTVTDSANGLTGSGSSTATVTAPATTTATPADPTPTTDPTPLTTPTVPPVVTLPVTMTGHRHHHAPAVSRHHASRRRG